MKTHTPVTRITRWVSVSILSGMILILSPGCEKEDNEDGIICPSTFRDGRDNQVYKVVKIGDQCWMAENLNVGTMIISIQDGSLQTNNDTIEKYCYNDDTSYCDTYGGLYEWKEAMQYVNVGVAQGICPKGWHIPTVDDWFVLSHYLYRDTFLWGTDIISSKAGGMMKEAGFAHWIKSNEGASNSSGFSGLPGGFRKSELGGETNYFNKIGQDGEFWSSYENVDNLYSEIWCLNWGAAALYRGSIPQDCAVSIRCLKDAD